MGSKVSVPNPDMTNAIMKLGGDDLLLCFQCGTCTAICPISEHTGSNFRKSIKLAQIGLPDKIRGDLTPWLCHACGECSDSCPRQARPTKILGALRRFLVGVYDWTGVAKRVARSGVFHFALILLVAIVSILAMYYTHGPIVLDRVELETFAPYHLVDTAAFTVLGIILIIMLPSLFRMYKYAMSDLPEGVKIPKSAYITEFIRAIPIHFLTQKYMSTCKKKSYWFGHLLIFYGFGFAFLATLTFVYYYYFEGTIIPNTPVFLVHPVLTLLGIISTILLFAGSIYVIVGRLRSSQPIFENSRFDDYALPTIVFLIALSGILVGIFRTFGYPLLTYLTYAAHLVFIAILFLVELPFSKLSHIIYRLFAIYFDRLKMRALSNLAR